jgi:F0F1-type ATP synthase assembly protein I
MDCNHPKSPPLSGDSTPQAPTDSVANRGIADIAWKTLSIQAACLVLLSAVAAASGQPWSASLLAGGMAALIPAGLSAAINSRQSSTGNGPAVFLRRYFAAEALKLASSAALLVATFKLPGILPAAILGGFIAVLCAGWFGMAAVGLSKGRHGA